MKKIFSILFLLLISGLTFSNKVDSLEKALPTLTNDSTKIYVLNYLSSELRSNNPKKSLEYIQEGLQIANKRGIYKEIVNINYSLAIAYAQNGNYPKASEKFFKVKELAVEEKDTSFIINVLSALTVMHGLREEPEQAMKHLNEKLRIDSILGKSPNARDYDMLGNLHENSNNLKYAILAYKKGIEIASLNNDSNSLASLYCNLGITLTKKGELDSAKKYSLLALEMDIKQNRLEGMATVYMELGFIEHKKTNYKLAHSNYLKSLEVGEQISSLELLEELYLLISENHLAMNELGGAYQYYKKHITLRDSLNNDAIRLKLSNIESQHEINLKDVEIAKHQAEIKAQTVSSQKKNQLIIGAFIGLLLVIIFALLLFNRFRIIKKQKSTIENQKHLVEEKSKEITDSIQYAKRIQSAILPPKKVVKECLQESFIYYKPKDIVAGDFYWIEQKNNKILFAAADCTGHGVPGAMVSVICNNGLNRSVREYGLTDPGKILDKTREIVVQEFEKSEEEVKDGMDIAICSIEGDKLQYAGAHNPLWIIRNNELLETKANKQPIGQFDNPEPYTTHTINLQKEDNLYIFSDGYADQFGGEKGKKMKSANFKKLLLSIQKESMERQKQLIDEAFENWKGDLDQLDDVCVIGIKV